MATDASALKSTESWAIPVIARENLPARFVQAVATYFASDEAPYMLLNPRQDSEKQLSDEKLICLGQDKLVILSDDRSPFIVHKHEVLTLRLEELLLAYSMTISTLTDEITIAYNAACADLFEPIALALRDKGEAPKDGRMEWQQVNKLAAHDLKFANYMRQLVRDSGQLIDYVLQPEMDVGEKTIAAAHLVILTETELIWVLNEEKAWATEPIYGAIVMIAPRTRLVSSTAVPSPEYGLIHLTITLAGDKSWSIPFAPERHEDLERLIAKIG